MTFKKRLSKLLIICSILAGLSLMVLISFKLNAVYYYQHSAVTDKDGIPFVVLDNLDWLVEGFEENGEFTYEIDGISWISYKPKSLPDTIVVLSQFNSATDSTYVLKNNSTQKIWYLYNNKFQLTSIEYYLGDSIPITEEEQSFAKQTLKTMTDPLSERVSAPIINLQWLYDGVYWIKERIEQ